MKSVILHQIDVLVRNMRTARALFYIDLAIAVGVSQRAIVDLEKGGSGVVMRAVVSVLEFMRGDPLGRLARLVMRVYRQVRDE